MSGQAEDKESKPETTVHQMSEPIPDEEVSELSPKKTEVSEHIPEATNLFIKEEDRPISEKSSRRSDANEAPSRHLWVGNVSTSVTEAEIAEQFSRFGDIESVTAYPSRNYAFVNFKSAEDGSYAKKRLQGTVLGGLAIRIEFAKGAKPSKHLWIGNISSSLTKEELEAECKRFGAVEDVRILHDRNCAFVDFVTTDDAVVAFENLNRKHFGTDELCVEYVKSHHHLKKDSRSDGQPRSDERNVSHNQALRVGFARAIAEKSKRDKDDSSEILWVGFPIYMTVDERKLHKAFSPFGAIERITTFPGRTYAFVQFHSVKAAIRAKNVLQGKLFNDARVSISFAKSEIGPVNHQSRAMGSWVSPPSANVNLPPLLVSKPTGFPNPRNDRFLGFYNFKPPSPGSQRRPESDMEDPSIFFQGLHKEGAFQDDMVRGIRSGLDFNLWGSPAVPEGAFLPPQHASHAPHVQQERWNLEEEALNRRDPKRPRGTGDPSVRGVVNVRSPDSKDDREPFHGVKAQDYISKFNRISRQVSDNWEDPEGFKRPAKRPAIGSDMDFGRSLKDTWTLPVNHAIEGFQWQGVIAKSGTSVCRARCFSIGKMNHFTFPEVVNCTARTSLDMLAKHIGEVGDFSVVSFVPLGDFDVDSYQEFVVYLSEKNRAAVCKLSQDSTLFLVPPSSFVEHFLKVANENNIIGVVLKLPQVFPTSTEQTGSFQHVHSGLNGFPAERFQKSASQAPLEQKSLMVTPVQAPFHGPAGTETSLLPSRSNVQSSSSSVPYSSTVGFSSTGSLAMASTTVSHGPALDDGQLAQMHFPPGYAFAQHQSSTPQVGSFNLPTAPASDFHPHQEHGMQIDSSLPVLASAQVPSTSAGQYPPSQAEQTIKSMSLTPASYPQQPPLPQYPHPSTQQKQQLQPSQLSPPKTHADQFSQLASILNTAQLQPFPDNLQAALQPQQPQTQSGSHLHQHFPQHQTLSASNSTPIKDQWPPTQPSQQPSGQRDDIRGQALAVDAEQRELLRLAQQKLSETKGESGEDNKKFQATLELAAALLQQLQQRSK